MSKKSKLTPMLKQFMEIKDQHPDKLLLFRMGDFYETFFEDAKIASKVLGITLTARNKKADDPIPLAGFPYHALDNYLDKLVKQGLKVVICEQTEDPKKAIGLVKRGIVDIITPGSIIDGKLIENSDFNFLAAIKWPQENNKIGLSLIDVSTGDFMFTELNSFQLKNELLRLKPVEILIEDKEVELKVLQFKLEYSSTITIFDSWNFESDEADRVLKKHFTTTTLEGFGAKNKPIGRAAAGAALSYIKSLKNDTLKHISNLRFYSLDNFMQLDETTRRNLELMRSMRYGDSYGSLYSIINKTTTPMGARKLTGWLLNPLLNVDKIKERLDSVSILKDEFSYTSDLRAILQNIGDLSRIISKIGTQRVNPREVIALRNYLETAPLVAGLLEEFDDKILTNLHNSISDYSKIIDLIDTTIVDEPPIQITDGNLINNGFDKELDELREISKSGKGWIARLEEEERKLTGISSLKVSYNRVFGYYIEITKTHKDKVPEHYIRKQTLVNAERYISPQLKEYEAKVLGAEERIKSLEYELFTQLRLQLFEEVELIQKYVEVISTIDVLSNFAYIAYHYNYKRPEFNDQGIVDVVNSRHPVIEQLLENEEFIPNDINLNDTDNLISLITGPNMAGKSTYLRQVGLLAIMAQMGSFIPADSAELPVFDKVFTRVGASDNLAMGQSTFLVEMIETANILNSATPKSLIILDEIGRGTSTFDGLSLAWSIVEYIHNNKKIAAKTLFATHYHELTELENVLEKVKNFNIIVREWNDEIIFLRKIERGCADQSYGIQVARLAGVPGKVIKRAKQILQNLEEHELSAQGLSATARKQILNSTSQLDIFDAIIEKSDQKDEILAEIKNVDVENITPIEAIKILSELQEKL
jgi:DNA mismatch repair protein MutS